MVFLSTQFRKYSKYSNEEIIELYQILIDNGYGKKYPNRVKFVNEYIQELEIIPDIGVPLSNKEQLGDEPVFVHKYLKYKQKYLKLKQKNLYL